MEHDYYWSYDKKSTPTDSYRVYWCDRISSQVICSTETKIVGPNSEVTNALLLTAMTLREANASLFIEPEQKVDMEDRING